MKKIFLSLIVVTTLFSCSKDCSWNTELFAGKTYKPTKIEINGVDATSLLLLSDPCVGNSYNFTSDGRYTTTNASGCTDPAKSGTWSVSTSGSTNTMTIDGQSAIATSFDCDKVIFTESQAGQTMVMTMTKQ